MDLKQLSDCSRSESDKYTESRKKENIFFFCFKYPRVMWFNLIVQER